jgi:hypothetical protein
LVGLRDGATVGKPVGLIDGLIEAVDRGAEGEFERVASVTFTTCAVLSGGFGIIGYLLLGEETRQIVLLNVQGSLFVSAVKLLLCVDLLLLAYPVVMRPNIVILEQSLLVKKNKNDKQQTEWAMHMAFVSGWD